MHTLPSSVSTFEFAAFAAALAFATAVHTSAADASASAAGAQANPTPWLTELSLTGKEYYDDNVLVVSGLGLPEQSSWVTDVAVRLGVDFAPLIGAGPGLSSLTLVYNPERVDFHQLSSENYTAHRINDLFKGKVGNFSYSLDNAFLYNDGNKLAETYAANQLSGTAGNQLDKYRNNYTHSVPRERRNQIQDRYTAQVRWDFANNLLFLRPISSLTYYNLNTDLFSTSKAPYLGYQDYIDRWDINGGADVGYNVTQNFALVAGYRDGFQHQDQFSPLINSDQHFAANHYQRALVGVEGQLTKWLSVKFSGGPDFRDYNPDTPIIHDRTTRYYGEGSATAILSKNQTLSFNYKQWLFVSSTGLVPYDDISYALLYHLTLTPFLGLDLGARYLEANYTLGDDDAGSAPSLRDDKEYEGTVGFSYLINKHFTAGINYAYDKGLNGLTTLAANYAPAYRDFEHGVVGFSLKLTY